MQAEKKLSFSQKTALAYELSSVYKVQPNERSPFLAGARSRLWLYYIYQHKTSKFATWMLRRVAEEPAIYDDLLTQKTATNMQNYMQQRGYFEARCVYETTFVGKSKAKTTYNLDLGPVYTIEKVSFASPDSNVLRILHAISGSSRLRPGQPMDGRQFEAEKLRITSELKNRGYAFFIPNYVNFIGDSSGTKTNVLVEVLTETDSTLHQTYTIGNVAVFSSLVPDYSSIRRDTTIKGIYFASSTPQFTVKPSRLYNAITIQPGQLYRQDDFDRTIRNLSSLGIFRFVSARPFPDSLQPEQLDVAISFSTNKRLPISGGVELNSSNSSVTGRLFGVSSNLTARNRNVFRGAEEIQTALQYNLEFDITNKNRLFFSQEFKFQNDLTFPRFFDYFGLWKGLWEINVGGRRLVSTPLYNRLRSQGQTRISASYNYLNLITYYSYDLFNSSFGYQLRSDPEHQYTFDNIGIDLLRPVTRPAFDTLLRNEFLRLSFGKQLFTGFIMRNFNYTLLGKPNSFGERWYCRLNAELSGLEIFVLNRLWSAAFKEQTWRIADVDFSKYLRLDADGSYTRDFTKNVTGAVRLGSGIVLPYGDTETAPYIKQFFMGGPSSVRGWRIRELGPGSYQDTTPPTNQIFYQAANFRLEANAELRFPLFWWVKGAIFIDAGNIWTLRPDPERPGAEIRWDSYKNIALGTGFGFRGDFDYFVLRFDLGLKIRQPYRIEATNSYWVYGNGRGFRMRDLNPNLSVGYPF
ncbi:MAG: BamA/TamA family outer membrane protein [Lewinellaceae bacterium]|nr:BamA/TamA family outer membrane protein [Lewinellaceae bacterium]